MSHARTKVEKLIGAKRLYLFTSSGLSDSELAQRLGIARVSAFRYRKELDAVKVTEGRYSLVPPEEDIQLCV